MYRKAQYLETNAGLITSEIEEVKGFITAELEKNGYYKGDVTFHCPTGVVLAILETLDKTFSRYEWNFNYSYNQIELTQPIKTVQIEVS